MNPIQFQARKLQNTFFSEDTALIYQNALGKTWVLIKETARLIFLLSLLFVVVVAWVVFSSFKGGRDLRTWLEEKQPTPAEILQKTSQFLLTPIQQSLSWAYSQVSEQLNIKLPGLDSMLEPPPAKPIEQGKDKAK
jgi:hypothetical protein